MRRHSQRFDVLIDQYRQVHARGVPELGMSSGETFKGRSVLSHAPAIKELVDEHRAGTLLDYGCGKGSFYSGRDGGAEPLDERWGVTVTCYDPAVSGFDVYPSGTFDGVICTDVLEHCPEEDLDWILADLFRFARRFVFASISCRPAVKFLPNGENAHCTVRWPRWWRRRLKLAAKANPQACGLFVFTDVWRLGRYRHSARLSITPI